MTRRFSAIVCALVVAFACGGGVSGGRSGDGGLGVGSASDSAAVGPGQQDSSGGEASTEASGPRIDPRECGGGLGSPIDLCGGPIECGVRTVCTPPQSCCIPPLATTPGANAPPICPCGMHTGIRGTTCAASCPDGQQACLQTQSGKNFDCPAGEECLVTGQAQIGNVQVPLAFCAPSGSPASSSSSSGGGGAGKCIGPSADCAGTLFECSSALSCPVGQFCCVTTVPECNACASSSGGSGP